ncbi:MAG: PQQ-dependent sugar dehydrogenase [Chloroflexota bacterium]
MLKRNLTILSFLILTAFSMACLYSGLLPAQDPTHAAAPTAPPGQPTPSAAFEATVGVELVAEGFTSPLGLVAAGDGSGRLFVIDQVGEIRILTPQGKLMDEPFLDLAKRIVMLATDYDERGLLGLAFHPRYAENGRFYVYYSIPLRADAPSDWNHTSRISEFHVSQENPNAADPASERIILEIDQPQMNHNGGQIAFGPDGYLYIPLGDGGGANDTGTGHTPVLGNAQDTSRWFGSILRIDVDGGDPYAIPADNPFEGQQGLEEIYAYGFRNPYRIAFDTGGEHQLFVGDAGQNLWEEVDIVTRGGNYGWNIKEGTHCFDPESANDSPPDCPETGPLGEDLIDPIIEYPNAHQQDGLGLVVIGGLVYRGEAIPALQGRYIFGDWSTRWGQPNGVILIASPPTDGKMWPFQELRLRGRENQRLESFLLSFGQDEEQELYVLTSDTPGPAGHTGKVYKLVP